MHVTEHQRKQIVAVLWQQTWAAGGASAVISHQETLGEYQCSRLTLVTACRRFPNEDKLPQSTSLYVGWTPAF